MSRGEPLLHLSLDAGLDSINAFVRRGHALGHRPDVLAKRLGDDVEVPSRVRGGVTHLLPETDKLLPKTGKLLPETDKVLPETDKVLPETPQSLIEIGASLSIHDRTLPDRPWELQACPPGYIRAHRWAMASISTRAPAGSLAACTVERAGGTSPACRL
jgi:hypothetical protein